jgi:hypothetical protein
VILVCAATGTEATACRQGIADAGAAGFEVLATGVGPKRAAEALGRRLRRVGASERPTLVVSTGFAGALTAGIEPLSWVTASAVYRLEGGRAVGVALAPGLLRAAEGARACHVISAGEIASGAVPGLGVPAAADMESAALAEVAAAAGLAFMVLRLITDAPERPLARVARPLAAALAAEGLAPRAAHGLRAALDAARSPAAAVAFLRDTAAWREALRAGWRGRAAGVAAAAAR